jgi:tetratricopeptide (TPR) repeat protein
MEGTSNMADSPDAAAPPPKRKYIRAVGPRLRVVLWCVFGFVAVLGANSAYLLSITTLEWVKGLSYQNYFYQLMFLAHLVLGLLLLAPFLVFCVVHIKNAHDRPNRRAVRVGYLLFAISLVLLLSGIALMRVEGFELKNPNARFVAYWTHVITPVFVVWLYLLHRLAGPKIKWRVGLGWVGAVAAVVVAMVLLHAQDPRKWNVVGPKEGQKYFLPSLARTATGNFVPARTLMMDQYCMECHKDGYDGWFHSAHHFSSFNNKPYLFSVKETREVSLKRDGNVKAARWCAGCHDPVPFFSGAFDDPQFDLEKHPTSQAGITCTACHSIVNVNSTIGNGDYTIEEPVHYPFAFSTNRVLAFLNRQMVKAKPDFHKKTFLKPLHKTAEFCSVCHKVSLPYEVNHYKEFLRGQNHYDTYLLSGVSGHGARSFYYPDQAKPNCAACHMPLQASADFGARFFEPTNRVLSIHNHLFPAANTGVAHIRGQPEVVRAHQAFLKDCARVDIFGVREGGTVDSPLTAPLRPKAPVLKRGQTYLLEVVLRTLKLGHPLTQGTVDSNEVWVDVDVRNGGRTIGRSGGLGEGNAVDPWSHFVNVYMLDKDGNRIDRRNPQDIFTPLYNHQIPPGAAQVAHYTFTVPEDAQGSIAIDAKLQYRKFDTIYMRHVFGKDHTNDRPITTIGSDRLVLAVEGAGAVTNEPSRIPEWQRWNDYGIGLLLEGDKGSEKGELIQASQAFAEVEKLGRADGPLNLARVYFKEGRLEDTVAALQRAAKSDPPAPRWLVAWFNALVNKQNGFLDQAITELRSILEDKYPELERRGFDFSKDYEVITELGQTLFERAKMEWRDAARQRPFLAEAREQFHRVLALDPENLSAHYNLMLLEQQLGNESQAAEHRRMHERYRPDDNARDRAITIERRRNPAADHAAQSIVLYPLQRRGAPGLADAEPLAFGKANAQASP